MRTCTMTSVVAPAAPHVAGLDVLLEIATGEAVAMEATADLARDGRRRPVLRCGRSASSIVSVDASSRGSGRSVLAAI